MTANKKSEPMDASFREARTGTPSGNKPRACYAIKTLVAEVQELFPETKVEYANRDGRSTALSVVFDLTALPSDTDRVDMIMLLELVESDSRVLNVLVEDGAITVTIRPNPRTQDSRDSFDLADALGILAEPEGYEVHSEGYSIIEGSS